MNLNQLKNMVREEVRSAMGRKLMESLDKDEVFDLMGYQPMTTFWQDFSIADKFGNGAISDTYRRVKAEWQDDYKYWTELCLVLNHKLWYWYDKGDMRRAALYDKLWKEADAMTSGWTEEEQQYYFRVTD